MADKTNKGNDEVLEDSSEITIPDFMEEADQTEEVVETTEEEAEESEESEEAEDTEESGDTEETEEEDTEGDENEDSEIDIESLAAEDKVSYLDQLYKSLDDDARRDWLSGRDGRIGKDVGKFRKERAIAIEERDEIQAKYDELVVKSTTDSNSPFASLITEDAIAEKEKSIRSELQAVEKWLESDEDYLEVGGKEYNAREIAKWPSAYVKQLELLKEQKSNVTKLSKVKDKVKEVEDSLKGEYDWLEDQDSSEFEAYQKLRKDPKWSRVLDFVPELATELPKVLAKFVSDTKPVRKPKSGLKVKGTRKPKGDLGSAEGGDKLTSNKKDKELKSAIQRLASGQASEKDALAMFM